MEAWLSVSIGVLALIILSLLVKIHLMQRAAVEIEEALADKLGNDTNTLIDISSHDRYMRQLANSINSQLRKLRSERHRFQQGDLELKTAITNISHDLRTPLTAICGYLDLLEQEEKSAAVSHYLNIIGNRADMLKQLTEELFRYSIVISAGNAAGSEPISLNSILEESLAAYYAALKERGIVPNIQMPDKNILRRLDRASLSRVFANLINNALLYSDGDLDISLSEAGEIIFTNSAAKLSEIQVGRLFDRFYTVEAARKSTGLGLAIARTLIEQMDGTIIAQYHEKKLCIYILLPDASRENSSYSAK